MDSEIYAVGWFFFQFGSVFGDWAAFVPIIKDVHGLTYTLVGCIKLVAGVGALLALVVVFLSKNALGSKIAVITASFAAYTVMPFLVVDDSFWLLVLNMLLVGFFLGILDIGCNAQGILVEKYFKVRKLGLFHAMYALGSCFGVLLGGGLEETSLPYVLMTGICVGVLVIPSIIAAFYLFPADQEKTINLEINGETDDTESVCKSVDSEPLIAINTKEPPSSSAYLLFNLCVLAAMSNFCVGSIADWSALYLEETFGATFIVGVTGYAVSQIAIALGRYYMDILRSMFSNHFILQVSGIGTVCGLVLLAMASWMPTEIGLAVGIISFGIVGLFTGPVFPLVISIAGEKVKDMKTTDALATVAALGYTASLSGPPLIGGLADVMGGLQYAYFVEAGILSVVFIIPTFESELLD